MNQSDSGFLFSAGVAFPIVIWYAKKKLWGNNTRRQPAIDID